MPGSPFPEVDLKIGHGSVLIAAITSCTNTSNPSVMLGAGLLAKKAVERGLRVNPAVKTSLGPGSRVVSEYLNSTGLQPYLDTLGFQVVGYGCTTCIGNSGPLDSAIEESITSHDLITAAVLSGNRNFEARIHQNIKANFLMSPPLVVAFALAGRVDIDLSREPLGRDEAGQDVYLRDLWPSLEEVSGMMKSALSPELFQRLYRDFAKQNPKWNEIPSTTGDVYQWSAESNYIAEPPFFANFAMQPQPPSLIVDARPLGIFGDSVTTDHISPAGAIKASSPAGKYLVSRGVQPVDFNSYGSRRGNDQVMTRGTFANVRIKNLMVPGTEGGVTKYYPDGETLSIYDAAVKYQASGRAAGHPGRARIRHRLQPRLGGERDQAAGSARGGGGELRAHPPVQSGGHGRAAAAISRWRERADPGAGWVRDLQLRRAGVGLAGADGLHDHHARRWKNGIDAAALADRYGHRGRLLPARRDFAVRAAANPGVTLVPDQFPVVG